MAVKSKKKVAKKTVKKVVKAKKTTAKRPSVKSVKKMPKKPVKKVVKKAAPKAAAKKTPKNTVKKVAKVAKKLSPVKTVAKKAIAPKKTEKVIVKKAAIVAPVVIKQKIPAPVKVEKKITPVKPLISKTIPKKKPMTVSTYDAVEDNVTMMDTSPSKKATTLLGALEFTPYQPSAGEAYMNEHQRAHFRKILDAWKQQLMQDVDTTVGHLKEEAVFYADPIDRASQEEGFNLELRTRDRERRLIKKIEQSLDLLNTGEYGFCEDCGADIGIRRLEARPTAVKCIDCKTFQEIREKQLGG